MVDIVRTRRTFTPGVVPTALEEGQLGINVPDKIIWIGDTGNLPVKIFDASDDGGGVSDHDELINIGVTRHVDIDAHIADLTGNPHGVTYAQTGAEQANSNIQGHIATVTGNPHAVTASDVGAAPVVHTHTEVDITNLDKYTKAEVNTLLAGKSDTSHNHDGTYAPVSHGHAADEVSYDNTDSGLVGSDVQDAIDEIAIAQAVGLIEYAAIADGPSGTIADDVNAMDWTGHDHAVGTALQIELNHVVTFGHQASIAYRWVGDKPVTLGIGGNYTAVEDDFFAVGTSDHTVLINRDVVDSHPTAAITGLDVALAGKSPIGHDHDDDYDPLGSASTVQGNLNAHTSDVANPHNVTAAQVGAAPAVHTHTEAQITDLDKYTQAAVDSLLNDKSDTGHEHDGGIFA